TVVPVEGGELRFTGTPELDIGPDAAPEWLGAEQSNSTMVLGERAVLKLLRKIQPGIHPDAEMVRYLTAGGFGNVPAILGEVWLEAGGTSSLLMLVQRFVHNQGDGWAWTLSMLERIATDEEWSVLNYESFACTFGRRLAEMHKVLERPSDNPAFAPEIMSASDIEVLANRIAGQLDTALKLLDGQEFANESDNSLAAYLADNHTAIREKIRAVARDAEGRTRARIHGDLHLGQVLVAGSDVILIDFEGEPVKPLEERRGKDIALRDVAGVLRSFDYAAAVAERNRPAAGETEEVRTEERYASFRESATTAFLDGYHGEEGSAADPLLDLFLLEKAAYEVAYEAANRPDWIGVPIGGLARAAKHLIEAEAA
ncbi:MAG: phosphotransferase, partial [Sphingobium sp.]